MLPETTDGEAERLLGGSGVDVLAGGHTHLQWARWIDGALYVNPGSVGVPYDRHQPADDVLFTPVAEYAVLTGGGVEFRRIPFDLDAHVAAGIDNDTAVCGGGAQPLAERVLTQKELNRATLARQLLLRRKADVGSCRDRAARRHAGAVAARAVCRHLVTHDELQARDARAVCSLPATW